MPSHVSHQPAGGALADSIRSFVPPALLRTLADAANNTRGSGSHMAGTGRAFSCVPIVLNAEHDLCTGQKLPVGFTVCMDSIALFFRMPRGCEPGCAADGTQPWPAELPSLPEQR